MNIVADGGGPTVDLGPVYCKPLLQIYLGCVCMVCVYEGERQRVQKNETKGVECILWFIQVR